MGFLSFLGVLSPLHINVYSFFRRKGRVGEDIFGNVYYVGEPRKGYTRERRWVMYKEKPEASMVPPEWHAWLHYQSDVVPSADGETFRRPWQKPHQPNMTGTSGAYRPPGHVLKGGKRAQADGDYEAWSPPE